MKNKNLNEVFLSVPFNSNHVILHIDEIIYCEADNYKTILFLKGKTEPITVCRTLKQIENRLRKCGFVHVHRSFVINIKHIKRYDTTTSAFVIMSNDKHIPVSKTCKDAFALLLHPIEV